MDTTFKGATARLKDIDIPRIGAEIGVGEDELHAFMQVEAAGSGFDAAGRRCCSSRRSFTGCSARARSATPR